MLIGRRLLRESIGVNGLTGLALRLTGRLLERFRRFRMLTRQFRCSDCLLWGDLHCWRVNNVPSKRVEI